MGLRDLASLWAVSPAVATQSSPEYQGCGNPGRVASRWEDVLLVAILDDDKSRRTEMESSLLQALPETSVELFDNAPDMIAWLARHIDDVAVVGFNNNPVSQFAYTPLASIERNDVEVAREISRMLLEGLENEDHPAEHKEIPLEFVWRESAG